MALSCEDIHEQITAYVDDRLDEEEYRRDVAAHIDSCPSCREAYQQEVMTKMVVRQRFQRVGTPPDILSSIQQGLDTLDMASPPSPRTSYDRSVYRSGSSRRSSPQRSIFFLLLLIAGLGAYILIFKDSAAKKNVQTSETETGIGKRPSEVAPPSRKSTGPANAFNFATDNYRKFASGGLKAQYETGDLAQLKSTFGANGVPGIVFSGLSLPLKGGIITPQNGVPLPQLLYSDGKTSFYILELSMSLLEAGKGAYITDDVKEKLNKGEPIWTTISSDENLVMYKNGDAVEVVVSNRSPVDMKKMLGLSGS